MPPLWNVPSGNQKERTDVKPQKRNKDLTDAYLQENSYCELHEHLQGRQWDRTRREWGNKPIDDMRVEPHHIFRGIHRWDILPNVIAVCRPTHDYLTDKPYSMNGNVLAMWVKQEKGELDVDLMRECFGQCPMAMMERWVLTEQWAKDLRERVLERWLNQ
jgi:hypothetical protein